MRSSYMGRLYSHLMLIRVSSNYDGPFSFTYVNESNNYYAWLDDICIGNSSNGVIKVTIVIVLYEEENFSDHDPVKCELVLKYQMKRLIVMNEIVMFDHRKQR